MEAFCRYDLRMSAEEYQKAPYALVLAMVHRYLQDQRRYRMLMYAITGDESLKEETAKPKNLAEFVNQQMLVANKQPVIFKKP